MSDHPKEAERNLKRIRICNDIWLDVFHSLPPKKVGLALALLSDRFDFVVDMHFRSRKWTLGKLRIYLNEIRKENGNLSEETLPFPHLPLPNSVVAFSRIKLRWLNSNSIAFLQRIGRLLESDVCLEFANVSNWAKFSISVWPLLNVCAFTKLFFRNPSDFSRFRRHISLSILCDCSNLRFIAFTYGQSLQFPLNDDNESSDSQALCQWVHTPRADDQPKVLSTCWTDAFPLDAVKTSFLDATAPVSFIIRLLSDSPLNPFELVNSGTYEQLTSRQIDDELWLIVRRPIDKNAKQWAEWESEAMEHSANDQKMLVIELSN